MKKVNEETRQLILMSAKELIKTEGIKKLNMRGIAAQSNIGLGTIYNYYKSKNDIIKEIVYNIHKEVFTNLKIGISNEDDTYKKLELVFYALRQFRTELKNVSIDEAFTLLFKDNPSNLEVMHKESKERVAQLKQIFKEILVDEDDFFIESIMMLFFIHAENLNVKYSQVESFVKLLRMEGENVNSKRSCKSV